MLAPGRAGRASFSDLAALQAAASRGACRTCLSELREQRLSEGEKLALMVEERCAAIRTQLDLH